MLLIVCCSNQRPTAPEGHEILPYYNEASFTPNWLDEQDPELENIHTIRDFLLVNQDGQSVSQSTFRGKLYITDFFFTTCPGICPKMTANLSILQDTFRHEDKVLLLSHSVTPEKDSVAVLKRYAEGHGVISGKWHLVTGGRQDIYQLGRHEYFVEEDLGLERDADEFLHTENFVLVDHQSRIRGIYNGLKSNSINQLISDVRILLKEIQESTDG